MKKRFPFDEPKTAAKETIRKSTLRHRYPGTPGIGKIERDISDFRRRLAVLCDDALNPFPWHYAPSYRSSRVPGAVARVDTRKSWLPVCSRNVTPPIKPHQRRVRTSWMHLENNPAAAFLERSGRRDARGSLQEIRGPRPLIRADRNGAATCRNRRPVLCRVIGAARSPPAERSRSYGIRDAGELEEQETVENEVASFIFYRRRLGVSSLLRWLLCF